MKLLTSVVAFCGCLAGVSSTQGASCPDHVNSVFADIHDGDKKQVQVEGSAVTIKSANSSQTWVVNAVMDTKTCRALVDFNVLGKPSPPPIPLTLTLLESKPATGQGPAHLEWDFKDFTGKLAPASVTLNRWVQLQDSLPAEGSECPQKLDGVFADMHDGDKKQVTVQDGQMTLRPSGNNQTWVVHAKFDSTTCSALVDFNVPGKPGPPPVSLKASLFRAFDGQSFGFEFQFTDPSSTLAPASMPLNLWVALDSSIVLL